MVKQINIVGIVLILLLLFTAKTVNAQVYANVELSKRSVYVQQPFRVNITVYTKTWFTAPLEFANLQIPNAFIIPFDKTQPGMFTMGGKQYPGVQFYYIVFPYKPGEFTIPSLEIMAQSPPEGSSTARKVTIHTQEQRYTVRDVPENLKDKGEWFVAKSVSLKEIWSPALKNLKIGDVVKRTIIINAQGTLPQFIPDLSEREGVAWASTYPQTPVLLDTRGGGDVNGRSTQTITYLLEKQGTFTVPAVTLSYWNPYTGKIHTESTKAENIAVADNPNLGILTSLKDSLSTTVAIGKDVVQSKAPFLILGMRWYVFGGIAIAFVLLFLFFYKRAKRLYLKLKNRRERYKQSEAYLFRRFMRSDVQPKQFLSALYSWWDSIVRKPSSSIGSSLKEMKLSDEEAEVKSYFANVFTGKASNDTTRIKKMMKKIRGIYTRKPIRM